MEFQELNLLFKCSKVFTHKKKFSCGLSDTECMICSYVYYHNLCSQDDVSQGLRIDKTTIAKAVAVLEKKGYLLRNQSDIDKRCKILQITDKGVNDCTRIFDMHNKWLDSIMSVLTPDEKQTFDICCQKIIANTEQLYKEQYFGDK